MNGSALYSDVVLPAATWYEKHDLSSTDLHPFVHTFNLAVAPPWETRTDFEIFKRLAETFSELAGHTGVRTDVVAAPLLHDTPDELAQPFLGRVRDWRTGECEPVPEVGRCPSLWPSSATTGPCTRSGGAGAAQASARGRRRASPGRPSPRSPTCASATRRRRRLAELAAPARPRPGHVRGDPRPVGRHQRPPRARGLPRHGGAHRRALADIARSTPTCGSPSATRGRSRARCSPRRSGPAPRRASAATRRSRSTSSAGCPGAPSPAASSRTSTTSGCSSSARAAGLPAPDRRAAPRRQQGSGDPDRAEVHLRFLSPTSKWSIHSEFQDNLTMLTLFRGGPVVWLSVDDAAGIGGRQRLGRGLQPQRRHRVPRRGLAPIPPGCACMYHSQDRHVNVPLTELLGTRGGTDNSVTRISIKPTHLIGALRPALHGFNYYGPTGPQRRGRRRPADARRSSTDEDPRPDVDGDEPRQVHRVPHLLGHLQERLDEPPRHGVRVVERRRDQARRRLPQALGGPGAVEGRLAARPQGPAAAEGRRQARKLASLFYNPDLRASTTTTSRGPTTTATSPRRRPRSTSRSRVPTPR